MTKDYLDTLASASVNNSRRIMREAMEMFYKQPSERAARRVEVLSGGELVADFLANDFCDEPRERLEE